MQGAWQLLLTGGSQEGPSSTGLGPTAGLGALGFPSLPHSRPLEEDTARAGCSRRHPATSRLFCQLLVAAQLRSPPRRTPASHRLRNEGSQTAAACASSHGCQHRRQVSRMPGSGEACPLSSCSQGDRGGRWGGDLPMVRHRFQSPARCGGFNGPPHPQKTCPFLTLKHVNVPSLGKRGFAVEGLEMRPSWIGWALHPVRVTLHKGQKRIHRRRERPCDNGSRDCTDMATSPRMP